jgi:hypothetical protein
MDGLGVEKQTLGLSLTKQDSLLFIIVPYFLYRFSLYVTEKEMFRIPALSCVSGRRLRMSVLSEDKGDRRNEGCI